MKRKFGTLIEEDLLRLARHRAAAEGKPLNDVIQEALAQYLRRRQADPARRQEAYRLFCEQPLAITREQFQQLLEGDSWES